MKLVKLFEAALHTAAALFNPVVVNASSIVMREVEAWDPQKLLPVSLPATHDVPSI